MHSLHASQLTQASFPHPLNPRFPAHPRLCGPPKNWHLIALPSPSLPAHPLTPLSSHFYGGKLRSGVKAEQRPPARGLAWPDPSSPLVVVEVEGREERADKGGSRVQRLAGEVRGLGFRV